MKNLLSMEDLTNEEILFLVKRATDLKKGAENKKRNNFMLIFLIPYTILFYYRLTPIKVPYYIFHYRLLLS